VIAALRRRIRACGGQAVLVAAATQPTSPIESKTPTQMTSAGAPARAAAIRWFRGYMLATTVLFFALGIFGFIVTLGSDDSIAGRIISGAVSVGLLLLRGSATSPSACRLTTRIRQVSHAQDK
jgi:hypothetical protein